MNKHLTMLVNELCDALTEHRGRSESLTCESFGNDARLKAT